MSFCPNLSGDDIIASVQIVRSGEDMITSVQRHIQRHIQRQHMSIGSHCQTILHNKSAQKVRCANKGGKLCPNFDIQIQLMEK